MDLNDRYIDVRDVIARAEELEEEAESLFDADDDGNRIEPTVELSDDTTAEELVAAGMDADDAAELIMIRELLADLRGNGGNEQWRGDWYPVTLIREDEFENHARELAEDIGAIDSDAAWPARHIDWTAAADELRMDYTETEIDGTTYLYR